MADTVPIEAIERLLAQHIVMAELRDFYRSRINADIEARLKMCVAKHFNDYAQSNAEPAREVEKLLGRITEDFMNPMAFTNQKK